MLEKCCASSLCRVSLREEGKTHSPTRDVRENFSAPERDGTSQKRSASCAEKIPACKTFSLLQEASVGLSELVPENERNALRVAAERELSTAHVGGGEADQSSLT